MVDKIGPRAGKRISFGRIAVVVAMVAGGYWLGNIGFRYLAITLGSLALTADAPATPDLMTFISQSMDSYPPLGLSPDKWPVLAGIACAGGVFIASKISAAGKNKADIDISEVHGSQELALPEDRKVFEHAKATRDWPRPPWCERVEDDNILLTKNTKIAASKNPDYRIESMCPNRHIFIMGMSGRGKTYTLVGPNALQLNGSYVFTDPKFELFREYAGFFEAHGYKVECLGLRDEETLAASSRYNPLAYCDDITSINQVVNYFIENTRGENQQSGVSKDYFENMERSFYAADIGLMVFWFKRGGNLGDCTMPALIDHLLLLKQEGPDGASALDLIFEGDPEDPTFPSFKALIMATYGQGRSEEEVMLDQTIAEVAVLKEYRSFKTAAGDAETMSNVISSCAARLSIFNNPALRRLLSADELELESMGKEKRALFLGIKAETGPYDFVAAMAVNQLFSLNIDIATKSPDGHLDIPIWCWLDELANVGKIPNLSKLIAVTRSYWINLIAIVQDGNQLEARYGKDAKSVMDQAAVFIFLGSQNWDDCKAISEKMGNTTRVAKTVSRNISRTSSSVTESYQPYSVPLMSPAELYNWDEKRKTGFDPAKCLTHLAGSNWCLDYKYDLHDHPRYAELEGKQITDFPAWAEEHRERRGASRPALPAPERPIGEQVAQGLDGNVIIASL